MSYIDDYDEHFKHIHNFDGKKFGTIIWTIALLIILLNVLISCRACTGGGDSDVICGSCGRTFTDSGNTRSIAYKNMCKNCYSNFKWSQDALDGLN